MQTFNSDIQNYGSYSTKYLGHWKHWGWSKFETNQIFLKENNGKYQLDRVEYSCDTTIRRKYNHAAAKSLQLCLTLCDPIDGSPLGSSVPGILQARTLEWVAISFSNVWKWTLKVKSLSRVQLVATPWTAAYQAPPPMGFSKQEYWSAIVFSLYARQQKRHRCIEQSFGLCGRGKGWDDLGEWHWNMYNIIYEINCQSKFDV